MGGKKHNLGKNGESGKNKTDLMEPKPTLAALSFSFYLFFFKKRTDT